MKYNKVLLGVTLIFTSVTLNVYSQWTKITSGTTKNLKAVSFADNLNGYAVGDGGQILKTTDGGGSWNVITTSSTTVNLWDVTTVSGTIYIVGDKFLALKSTDGGASWQNVGPASTSSSDFLFGIQCLDANTCFAAGGDGNLVPNSGVVFVTTNGGSSWQETNVSSMYFVDKSYFVNSNIGYAVGYGSTGAATISKTINGGTTWTTVYASSSPGYMDDIFCTDENHCFTVGLNSLKTQDGGASWTSVGLGYWDVDFNGNHGILTGKSGQISESLDNGNTWNNVSYATTDAIFGSEILNNGKVIAVGQGGLILVKATSGINTYANPLQAKVYPTLTSGHITIELNEDSPRNTTISVMNILGDIVWKNEGIINRSNDFDLKSLGMQPGIYIIKMDAIDEHMVQKVVLTE